MKTKSRKEYPVFRGLFVYFPDALLEVAHLSLISNEQHNPGTELHWDRTKSTDHLDAMLRHTLDMAQGTVFDTDGLRHSVKTAWRALAHLQTELEKKEPQSPKKESGSGRSACNG